MEELHYDNGRIRHRVIIIDGLTVYENYYDNEINSLEIQRFFNDKIVMIKEYYESGNLKLQTRYEDGKEHREIGYYDSGMIKLEVWYHDGEKHNINSPAEIYYTDDISHMSVYKAHYFNGKLHNDNGCAEWKFCKYEDYDEDYDGTISTEEPIEMEYNWYKNGVKYKSETHDGFHKISEKNIYDDHYDETEYENGEISTITRAYNDSFHFEAYIDNKIYCKMIINGKYHYREYYDNEIIVKKLWYYKCKLDRLFDLPSMECYEGGKLIEKHWYQNGIKHRDEGFAEEFYQNYVLLNGNIWKNGKRIINFEKYIEEEACSICYDLKEDMILTPCRHIFCKTCIHKWIDDDNDSCPYCRQKI